MKKERNGREARRRQRDKEIGEKKKFEGFGVLMRLRGKKSTPGRRKEIWE